MLKPYKAGVVEPQKMRKAPKGITTRQLRQFGKLIVQMIQLEIQKDWGKRGIPKSQKFLDSFGYKVERNKIVVYSTWHTVAGLLEGRRPYRMTWLTRERGIDVVPILLQNGEVIMRATPATASGAWIHPGYARHTFVARALKKARLAIAQVFLKQALREQGVST